MVIAKIYWSEVNDWGSYHSYEETEEFDSYEDLMEAADRWHQIGCEDISFSILYDSDLDEEDQ